MDVTSSISEKLRQRLQRIYTDNIDDCVNELTDVIAEFQSAHANLATGERAWDQRDIVLITYGDQIHDGDRPTLAVLREFIKEFGVDELINSVHILPFYPYSSDDGFSVIDYRQVASHMGDWKHVTEMSGDVRLMFDLVLNHCSQHSQWFKDYLLEVEPFNRYFIDIDPDTDLSQVVRPRTHPLLTPFQTASGTKHVWTTFSADQVDLNFGDPKTLVEMTRVLLDYVAHGASIVRLDAIAFLWKEIGTDCLHRPQTHEVVKLMRDVISEVAPHVWLLTETNVPHKENVSYFGDGDEAQMVYQFSLPPLLLDAFLQQDAGPLKQWLSSLEPAPAGTTFFNFTASHDGIGMRPLEGLVEPRRFDALVEHAKKMGGRVSAKRNSDGSESPYELNCTYLDMLADEAAWGRELGIRRFLSSQAVMLAMPGVPAVYFQSLVGGRNDQDGVAATGAARSVNRHKYDLSQLQESLRQTDSIPFDVFHGYRRLLQQRTTVAAFHPNASYRVVENTPDGLFIVERVSVDGGQTVWATTNVTQDPIAVSDWLPLQDDATDLITGRTLGTELTAQPFETLWITNP